MRHHPRSSAHGWWSEHPPEWHAPWWDPEAESRRFNRRSSRSFRLLAPVILSLLVQLPTVFVHWRAGQPPMFVRWASPMEFALEIGIALIGPLALLGARRFPGPVVAIVAVAASIDLLRAEGADGPPYIALAFAIGSAIIRDARVWAWVTIAASWIGTLAIAYTLGLAWQPWRVAGITIGILLVVGLAEGVRTRRMNIADGARRVAARRQNEVQAERVRIARELHDVLAHSLSQINVQAGVALHLIDKQPSKARDALSSIKDTSKTALDEVRSVLGVLRAEGGPDAPLVPEPDLSRLPRLAESTIAQGVDVQLETSVTDVSKPIQLALYRIVQESLTNIVRHAAASRATVTLREVGDTYELVVSDDGAGAKASARSGEGGRGLLGMRERAELLGGTLDAGPGSDGGFDVRATIPTGRHE
jgi:signal transduction histidine kinase